GLQPGRVLLPLRMSEIRVCGACRDDQIVVRKFQIVGLHDAVFEIKPSYLAEQDLSIRRSVQDIADGRGDLSRRQHRQSDLIKKRLESMVVLAIQNGDA